jgi:hypothetical protein
MIPAYENQMAKWLLKELLRDFPIKNRHLSNELPIEEEY